jgi:glycosyltransferase involved in cell wall biosynthesis
MKVEGRAVPGFRLRRKFVGADGQVSRSSLGRPRLIYFAPADIQIARVDRNCIVKFCEAMQQDRADVTLVSARVRVLETEPTASRSIWDVFGVRHVFNLKYTGVPIRQERLDTRRAALSLQAVRAIAYPFAAARLLLRERESREPTVLYAKNYGPLFGLALASRLLRKNTRILFEAHVPPRSHFQIRALREADGIVCNGYAIREALIQRGIARPERSIAVHQGFTPEAYPEVGDRPVLRSQARERLGWGELDQVAVYTGKVFWPYKEIDLLLEAASQLSADGIRMVIIGGRADNAQLWRDEAERRGVANVLFTGFVAPSQIVDYQVAADALLSYYPSGLDLNDFRSPGKLFEYMASGTPIVAADYASLREVLENERNAILIEPDKPELLAAAIRRLMRDPALGARLGAQARTDAGQYTWTARAGTIAAFLSSLERK